MHKTEKKHLTVVHWMYDDNVIDGRAEQFHGYCNEKKEAALKDT